MQSAPDVAAGRRKLHSQFGVHLAVGAGSAIAMVQWLEYCGTFSGKSMTVAIAAAYLMSSLFVLGCSAVFQAPEAFVTLGACAGLSLLLFVRARFSPGARSSYEAQPRSLAPGIAKLLPPDIVLWTVVSGAVFCHRRCSWG